MDKVTTRTQIEVLADQMISIEYFMTTKGLPDNVKLVVELSESDYNELVPEQARGMIDLEFNTHCGIRFHPIKK